MTIGQRSTLSGDPVAVPGLERAVPDLSIAATDRPLRPGQYVYVETHAWWLTTHGPHQLLAEHRLRQWVPADAERDVGARARGHRRPGVAQRLGRGGPRRGLRPAPRGAGRPVPGPARRVRRRRRSTTTERPCGTPRAGRGGAGRPPPASSSPGSRAIPTRSCNGCARRTRAAGSGRSRPGSPPCAPASCPPTCAPRCAWRWPACPACAPRRASRTSTAWRASRSSTTPGAPAPS